MVSVRRTVADLGVFGRGYIRSRIGVFFALVFPIILILLFGAIFSGGGSGTIPVYVQNQDGAQVSTAFVNAMNGTTAIRLVSVAASQNFTEYLLSHSSSDGVIIPRGFSAAFAAGRAVDVILYGNPTSTTSSIVNGITDYVVNAFNLQRAGGSQVIGIQSLIITPTVHKYIDFLVPGLIGFSVLTSPMFALVNITSEYKRDKIFK